MIYGLNTPSVQAIIDRIPTLTEDECKRLAAARDADYGAAWSADYGSARNAAYDATWNATWNATWKATLDATRDAVYVATRNAAWNATRDAAYGAAWNAIWDATLATLTYDLATEDGSYTIAHRDLLLAPWVSVCGMPEALIDAEACARPPWKETDD